MQPLRIAVTGVPGSGKTSFCSQFNYQTISVLELAIQNNAVVQETLNSEVIEIDIEQLNKKLSKLWQNPPNDILLVDGHLSHNLPVDCIVLLRCRPDVLEHRLKERNWSEEKVSENVEFEFLSAIINELNENILTLELDNTKNTFLELKEHFLNWFNSEKNTHMLNIDWIKELHS